MSELEIAEAQTRTDLTRTQKESGDYPKGHIVLKNIPITIENPRGSVRSGYSKDGVFWESKLFYTYGYIDNTIGADGDEIDIFLGPLADSKEDFLVYIVHQIDPTTGIFDEYKIMFGFSNSSEAKKAYLSCYDSNWRGFGSMSQISLEKFPTWLQQQSRNIFVNELNNTEGDRSSNIKLIRLESEVLEGKTLLDLQQQAGDLTNVKTVVVSIASPGGDVSEGMKIMMWFDQLSSMGIKVVTIVISNAYSIASLIMLAADHILIAKDADVMVHNPMVPNLELVNANDLESYIKELRELESIMYELYVIFTNLSTDEIKELMDNETYLSATDAVKYGFADEIVNIQKRPKVIGQGKLKLVNMKKTLNILNQVIALVGGSSIVNQSYYDEKGGEIEIFQQDPSCYSTGDKTSVENGSVKLADGSILNIEEYVIKSIDKAVPVQTEPTVQTEPPVSTEKVEPILEPPVSTEKVEPQANFNEGPSPKKEIEMKTEVTKTETTKTEPIQMLATGETAPQTAVTEEPKEMISFEQYKDLVSKYENLVSKYEQLDKRFQTLEKEGSSINKKMEESDKFQEVATEAIKMIARNTTSNFSPSAKATVGDEPRGSIFQQAKARVEKAKSSK